MLMTRFVIIIIMFGVLLVLSLATVARPLFLVYSKYVLSGSYVGETYVAYFIDFILYYLSPFCMLVSIVSVTNYYKLHKKG
jgi:hypothetical protein